MGDPFDAPPRHLRPRHDDKIWLDHVLVRENHVQRRVENQRVPTVLEVVFEHPLQALAGAETEPAHLTPGLKTRPA